MVGQSLWAIALEVGKLPPKLTLPAEFGIIAAELVEVPLVVESSKLCG